MKLTEDFSFFFFFFLFLSLLLRLGRFLLFCGGVVGVVPLAVI